MTEASGERSRADYIQATLDEITRRPEFPAFADHVQQVMTVVADEQASLRRLTDFVVRDYSLTLKVLRTANSAWYNRSGQPILSVAHAIALLGVEAIRDLAGSLLLFEHYHGQAAPGVRELMLLSLLTANQARAVAALAGYPRREEAYICGMFRNLGEVLVACYFPREYAAILAQLSEARRTEHEACLRVLHYTYEDLGQAMSRTWNLPEKVGACMSTIEPPAARTTGCDADLLRAAASFSHALTSAVWRRGPEGASARMNRLMEEYTAVLGLTRDDVSRVLDAAILDTRSTFATLRMPLDELRLRRQAEAALAVASSILPSAEPALQFACGEELLEHLAADLTAIVDSREEFELSRLIVMVLEAILRGGPFDRVLFCLANPERTHVQGRLGLGDGVELVREKFRFPISARGGPIGTALAQRRDLCVDADAGPAFPEMEMLRLFGAQSFHVYPIMVDDVVGACLYFDRVGAAPAPTPRSRELLRRLRDVAALAIARHHAVTKA